MKFQAIAVRPIPGIGEHLHRVGAELHGTEPVQPGGRHGHDQRQEEGGGGGGAETNSPATVALGNHHRDLLHLAGETHVTLLLIPDSPDIQSTLRGEVYSKG